MDRSTSFCLTVSFECAGWLGQPQHCEHNPVGCEAWSLDTTGQHVRQILAEFGLLSGDPKPYDIVYIYITL